MPGQAAPAEGGRGGAGAGAVGGRHRQGHAQRACDERATGDTEAAA